MMKKNVVYIFVSIFLIAMVFLGIRLLTKQTVYYDQRLEPVIIRVYGITRYTESSSITSLVQYYNEDDGLYYYDVMFEYEQYAQDSTELVRFEKEAVFIIDHDVPGDNGDFYFISELNLDEYQDVLNQYNLTKSLYPPIASYSQDELTEITQYILDEYWYDD